MIMAQSPSVLWKKIRVIALDHGAAGHTPTNDCGETLGFRV